MLRSHLEIAVQDLPLVEVRQGRTALPEDAQCLICGKPSHCLLLRLHVHIQVAARGVVHSDPQLAARHAGVHVADDVWVLQLAQDTCLVFSLWAPMPSRGYEPQEYNLVQIKAIA